MFNRLGYQITKEINTSYLDALTAEEGKDKVEGQKNQKI